MRLSLLLFLFGLMCFVSGYVQQLDNDCQEKTEYKLIPEKVMKQKQLERIRI